MSDIFLGYAWMAARLNSCTYIRRNIASLLHGCGYMSTECYNSYMIVESHNISFISAYCLAVEATEIHARLTTVEEKTIYQHLLADIITMGDGYLNAKRTAQEKFNFDWELKDL